VDVGGRPDANFPSKSSFMTSLATADRRDTKQQCSSSKQGGGFKWAERTDLLEPQSTKCNTKTLDETRMRRRSWRTMQVDGIPPRMGSDKCGRSHTSKRILETQPSGTAQGASNGLQPRKVLASNQAEHAHELG
jgi:hypothetical protein